MISLYVEQYCQDCVEFRPKVEKHELFADFKIQAYNTDITCAHARKCRLIKKYLEAEETAGLAEQKKDD